MIKGDDFFRAFEGWYAYKNFFGNGKEVSAEFIIPDFEKFNFGIGLNISFDENYQLRFFKNGKDNVYISLMKKDIITEVIEKLSLSDTPFRYGCADKIRLKLKKENNILKAYLNGREMFSFKLEKDSFKSGYCGVWCFPETVYGCLSDFSCDGINAEIETICEHNPKPCDYKLKFDAGKPLEWFNLPQENGFVMRECENVKMFSSSSYDYSREFLFAFDNDSTVNTLFTVNDVSENSKFGFLLRNSPDTAFLKIEYDFKRKGFTLSDCPALFDCEKQIIYGKQTDIIEGVSYNLSIMAENRSITVLLNDKTVLSFDGLRQINYGKIALFSEKMFLNVLEFSSKLSCGFLPSQGISYKAVDNCFAASMELEELPDGNILGITKSGNFISDKDGTDFIKTDDYDGCLVNGCYQSVLKLYSGGYLQVLLSKQTAVQYSDDMIHWKNVGRVIPKELFCDQYLFHTKSLTQVKKEDGGLRIFLPITVRTTDDNPAHFVKKAHNTEIYFSDDLGKSWQKSEKSMYEVLNESRYLPEWAESKIIPIGSNAVRMYCSRTRNRFMAYSDSFDGGLMFSKPHYYTQMPCAKSSFAICEDKYNIGTFYMVFVNDCMAARGVTNFRTRLSLLRSYDGKNWSFVCDVERNGICFPDNPKNGYSPIFQILDPCILATEKYIFVSFGISARTESDADIGTLKAIHNAQRVQIVRLNKQSLTDRELTSENICNTNSFNRTKCEVTDDDIY